MILYVSVEQVEFRFFFLKFEVSILRIVKLKKKKPFQSEDIGTYCPSEQRCCYGLWLGS